MVPQNFKLAINYAWNGLMGAGNWAGYIMAATYYLSDEFGFGPDICEFFGYGNWVIEQLYTLVSFMPKGEEENSTGDNSKLASQVALENAAAAALNAGAASLSAQEQAAKDALQAENEANGTTAAQESSAETTPAETTPAESTA